MQLPIVFQRSNVYQMIAGDALPVESEEGVVNEGAKGKVNG